MLTTSLKAREMRSPLTINKCTQSLVNDRVCGNDALQQRTKLEKATKGFLV